MSDPTLPPTPNIEIPGYISSADPATCNHAQYPQLRQADGSMSCSNCGAVVGNWRNQ